MKTTMEIPDELYRRLKANSAAQGKTVREVVVNLVQEWLDDTGKGGAALMDQHDTAHDKTAELRRWLDEAAALTDAAPPGPTALEHLMASRNRLEPPTE